MTFRFRQSDGTVEAGLRRIACEQIDAALAAVRSRDLPPERAIHAVRQRCKAMRALIRLVRSAFPAHKVENAMFRDVARGLSHVRDGKVLSDTLDLVVADDGEEADRDEVDRLRARLIGDGARTVPLRTLLDPCEDVLLAARVRAATWPLTADGWAALEPGLVKTMKNARRAMAALAIINDAERSHEWRKHAKDHWYHVRLLRIVSPGEMRRRADRAGKLAELLGERHDLDMLVGRLGIGIADGSSQPLVEQIVDRARDRAATLDDKAQRIGKHLFAQKPRKLAERWGEGWER